MPVENNTGKCYTYRDLKFYAKNGFICLHDEEDGAFFVLTRKEFLLRAQALSDDGTYCTASPTNRTRRQSKRVVSASASISVAAGSNTDTSPNKIGHPGGESSSE